MTKQLNVWNYKPRWCQPWSILLTGIVLISSSWILAKSLWLTALVSLPIGVWWFYFLILWPKLIQDSGILDNFEKIPEKDGLASQNAEVNPEKLA